jgi:hypothetical protein
MGWTSMGWIERVRVYKSEQARQRLRRAFDRTFGGRRWAPADPEQEPAVRIHHADTLAHVVGEIGKLHLSTRATEAFLNCLTRDLLPDSYLSKVRKI